MLNKIFISKRMNKNNFAPLKSKVLSSGYDHIDFERDRKLKLLENLFSLKLDKEHIDKSSLLLYNCKKTKNYPLKRKYLKKTVYNYDEDNNLYITFPKFNSVGKKLKDKSKTIECLPKEAKNYFITDKNTLDDDDNIEDLRKKINEDLENNNYNYNYNTISNNEDTNEEDRRGKLLYKLLKTKYTKNDNPSENNRDYLPRILNKGKEELSMLKRISDVDPMLGRKIYENRVKSLTKKQKLDLLYLSELELFNSLDKLNTKKDLLNKSKNSNSNSRKKKLLIKDLFHYDKKKWNKLNYDKKMNENEAIINELNEKNKEKLSHLKSTIDKLEYEKMKTEIDVKETINNINLFLEKNGTPLNFRNMKENKSLRSSKNKGKK